MLFTPIFSKLFIITFLRIKHFLKVVFPLCKMTLKVYILITVPDIAKIKSYTSTEVNGWIYLWYHAEGSEPTWKIPVIPEIQQGQWVYKGRTEHYINCHIEVRSSSKPHPNCKILKKMVSKTSVHCKAGSIYSIPNNIKTGKKKPSKPYILLLPGSTRERRGYAAFAVRAHAADDVRNRPPLHVEQALVLRFPLLDR